MEEPRRGRQTPTCSVVLTYKSTKGQEAAELYRKADKEPQEWQEIQLCDIMAVNEDGLWVHTKYGYEVPRRNGKGEILVMRELWGLAHGEKIMHTAHRTPTSHSAWERLYNLVKASGLVITSEYRAMGKEHIYVEGGGRIEFRTRTSKGGLGEGYDLLIIDEAQEYQDDQESSLKYVVSDSRNPQTILCGTPPTAVSSGTVFVKYREDTLRHRNVNAGWAEWSVEQETDPNNVDAWYETNPAMGEQLNERKVKDEIGSDVIDFNIQRLGLWISYNQKSVISRAQWKELQVKDDISIKGKVYVGIKYGVDATNVALAVAVKTDTEKIFVEALGCKQVRAGNKWILDLLGKVDKEKVAVDGKAGQDLLAEEMKERKLGKVIKPTVKEVIIANTLFEQGIESGKLCHNGQPSLEEIAANCEKRQIGGGGFGYKSLKPDMEIALLDSVILAYWLAAESKEKKKQQARY